MKNLRGFLLICAICIIGTAIQMWSGMGGFHSYYLGWLCGSAAMCMVGGD